MKPRKSSSPTISPRRVSSRNRPKTQANSLEDNEVADLFGSSSKNQSQVGSFQTNNISRFQITPTNDSKDSNCSNGSFQVPTQPPRPSKRKIPLEIQSSNPKILNSTKNSSSQSQPSSRTSPNNLSDQPQFSKRLVTSKARRALFPSNQSGNLPMIDFHRQNRELLRKNLKRKCDIWGYDFGNDRPVNVNDENISPMAIVSNTTNTSTSRCSQSSIESEPSSTFNPISATGSSNQNSSSAASLFMNTLPLTGGSVCGSVRSESEVGSSSIRSSPVSMLSQSERSEFGNNSSSVLMQLKGAWQKTESAPKFYQTRSRAKKLKEVEADIRRFENKNNNKQAEENFSNLSKKTFIGINATLTSVIGAENITDHTKINNKNEIAIFEDTRSDDNLKGVGKKLGKKTPLKIKLGFGLLHEESLLQL